jgi:predicted nucleic acid-binding protein
MNCARAWNATPESPPRCHRFRRSALNAIASERVWDLRNNLTAYDAVYVALAEALDAPLLTRDQRLAAAAGHHARVELV